MHSKIVSSCKYICYTEKRIDVERGIFMNKELHTRIEEENDFNDAIAGFGVGFVFFFGIIILAIVLETILR